MPTARIFATGLLAATLAGVAATPSHAGLTLTAAGIAQGLTLSTFVNGVPSSNTVGPISTAYPSNGNVLMSSYATGKIIAFSSNADGQSYASGTPSTTSYDAPTGMATYNGNTYLVEQGNGHFDQVDANGNLVSTLATGLGSSTGLSIANGFAYISNVSNSIYKVDLSNNAVSTLVSGQTVDGVTLSPDGTVLYGTLVGGPSAYHVLGWDAATGAPTGFDSGYISGADGAAAAVGTLAGNIFVNTNNGELYEVDSLGNQTLVANGGTRGDLVSIDPTNGSLLLSQTDSVVRLTLPAGSSFSGDLPEPASIAVLGCGLLGLAGLRRRRR